MEIHGLHSVAWVKEMEMAHCISHALGHPRTVGVSARWFLERIVSEG